MAKDEKIKIYGEIFNNTPDGIATRANQIFDTEQGRFQDDINAELLEGGGGGGGSTKIVEITYSNLKELRDNSRLVPGRSYRITDYVTKVADSDYFGSKEHPFDIIVTALDEKTLSENASAIQHGVDAQLIDILVDVVSPGEGTRRTTTKGYSTGETIVISGTTYYKWEITDMSEEIIPNRSRAPQEEILYLSTVQSPTLASQFYLSNGSELMSLQDLIDRLEQQGFQATCTITSNAGKVSEPYFANSNLAAWKLKYSLDAPSDVEFAPRPTTVSDSIRAQVVVDNINYNTQYVTFTEQVDPSELDPELKEYLDNRVGIGYPYTVFQIPEGVNVYGNDDGYVYKVDYVILIDRSEEHGTYFELEGINVSELVVCDHLKYDSSQDRWSYLYNEIDGDYTHQDIEIESHELPADHKGFISYMKDEFCNECNYDFKNIGEKFWDYQEVSSFNTYADIYDNGQIINGQLIDFNLTDSPLNDSDSDSGRSTRGRAQEVEPTDPDEVNQRLTERIKMMEEKGAKWYAPTVNGNPVQLANTNPDLGIVIVSNKILAIPYTDKYGDSGKENDSIERPTKSAPEKSSRKSDEDDNHKTKRTHKHIRDIYNAPIFDHEDDVTESPTNRNTKGDSKDDKTKTTVSIALFAGFYEEAQILYNGQLMTWSQYNPTIEPKRVANASLDELYCHAPVDPPTEKPTIDPTSPKSQDEILTKSGDLRADPLYPSSDMVTNITSTALVGYLFMGVRYDSQYDEIDFTSTYDESLYGNVSNNKMFLNSFIGKFSYTTLLSIHNDPDEEQVYLSASLVSNEFDSPYYTWFATGKVHHNKFALYSEPDYDDYDEYGMISLDHATGCIFNDYAIIPIQIYDEPYQGDYKYLQNKPVIPAPRTPGDGKVTLVKKDGSELGAFSVNQSNDTQIEISTSDNVFCTQEEFDELEDDGDLNEDTNYFIEGELSRVAETGDYEDLKNKPTNLVTGYNGSSYTLRYLTQSEYDDLVSQGLIDQNTIYLIYDPQQL